MDKKRILMTGAVNLSVDSAAKVHFSNLAKEFSKKGFKVLCLAYSSGTKAIDTSLGTSEIKTVPNPLIGNLFLRALKYLFLMPLLLWHLIKFAPNIVYFRFSPPAFVYLLTLKLIKVPFLNPEIILEFNSWVSEERAIQNEGKLKVKLIDFLQLKSVPLVDHVRVVVPGIKAKLDSFGVDCRKVAVIRNGTDTNHFKPIDKAEAKEKIGLEPDSIYVGFIGNFAIWQGLNHLLLAIPKVWEAYPDVRFLLVGDGLEMPKIRKEASKLNKEKIILTGRVPYRKANLYINAFDIGVAPFIKKRNEVIGLSPLKIYDYSACGVPIISSRIKGLEIIEEKNFGILVEPENPLTLADSIIKLLENAKLRGKLGKNGRKVAEKEFSWRNVVEKILNAIIKS